MSVTAADKRRLDEDGFVVLEDFIDPGWWAALSRRIERLFAEEGEGAGSEFKTERGCRRLATLAAKAAIFRRVAALPRLLDYVRYVLDPDIKLSSLNARSVDPHGAGAQPLHADMAAVADERG